MRNKLMRTACWLPALLVLGGAAIVLHRNPVPSEGDLDLVHGEVTAVDQPRSNRRIYKGPVASIWTDNEIVIRIRLALPAQLETGRRYSFWLIENPSSGLIAWRVEDGDKTIVSFDESVKHGIRYCRVMMITFSIILIPTVVLGIALTIRSSRSRCVPRADSI